MDKLAVIDSMFGVRRALIGVVHLQALPGTPQGKLDFLTEGPICFCGAQSYQISVGATLLAKFGSMRSLIRLYRHSQLCWPARQA